MPAWVVVVLCGLLVACVVWYLCSNAQERRRLAAEEKTREAESVVREQLVEGDTRKLSTDAVRARFKELSQQARDLREAHQRNVTPKPERKP